MAKDLTFEAKAKDFKMCHQELRLCYLGFLAANFNAKIAQQMWLFPRSLNSDKSAVLSYFKKIFAIFACIHSEQGGFFKISFVGISRIHLHILCLICYP